MATSTKERLLHAAHDLFYRDGFHTVGLEQILTEVGVTKTTFYNHFESKDELMVEVLRWHDRWWRDIFAQKLREYGGDTPRGQLTAVFDVIEEFTASEEFNGCIFINVAVQFPLPHLPAHQAAVKHKQQMEDILRELAGYAGAEDALALAKEISLVMEGAYITRHITGDVKTADIGRHIAKMVIDKHLPAKV